MLLFTVGFSSSVMFEVLVLLFLFLQISISYSGYLSLFYGFCIDKLSLLLVALLVWLFIVLVLLSVKYVNFNFPTYKLTLILLFCCLLLTFLFKDLLGFYMFFELSLLPLMFVILGWGYQVERIQASFYLTIYTIVGSLPLLLVFLFFFQKESLFWVSLSFSSNLLQNAGLVFILLFISFSLLVKLPLYGLHLWLPKAHVEAPVSGSMVLAAVLLKLSVYGFYRLMSLLSGVHIFSHWFVTVLIWGAVLSRSIALRQRDIKSLVAYSSIAHMGVILSGMFCFSSVSVKGALIVMLGHGFCSSALFYLVNFHYERNLTRQILLMRGQIRLFVSMAIWWFLFLVVNFSAPPFLNLIGEVLIMLQLVVINITYIRLAIIVSFLVAAFCLFVFRRVYHGKPSSQWVLCSDLRLHHLVLSYHFIPLLLLIFKLEVLSY